MACRRQTQEVAASGYIYDKAQTGRAVEEYYWPRPSASAPPAAPGRDAAATDIMSTVPSPGQTLQVADAVSHAFRMADDQAPNVQLINVVLNNVQINVNNAATNAPAPAITVSEDQVMNIEQDTQALADFQPNDPKFRNCQHYPQGVDFGKKEPVVGRYKAEKDPHSPHKNVITYTQCGSPAQAIAHALTLHLSSKRTKHIVCLFDSSLPVDQLTSKWRSTIHLSEVESLIQQLGPNHEYHRGKVKTARFSLYFYVIKRIGVRFSEQGRQNFINLSHWAHSLEERPESANNDLSISQVISQLAKIGLAIVGVL